MIELSKRILNVRPDPLDPRDRDFDLLRLGLAMPVLPESVDHSQACGPVLDQGETGSCVGQACASLLYWKFGKEFSPRWVWMGAKERDSWMPSVCFEYAGTTIRDAFKFMQKYGACESFLWPMDALLPHPELEQTITENAAEHRIGEFWKIRSVTAQKRHLVEAPFVVGVPVYENWEDIGPDGIVPEPDGGLLGGHALLMVGYDPICRLAKNSWSEEHGDRGLLRFSYEYPMWDCLGAAR